MNNFGIKYFAMVGGLTVFFANFIACGSQLYQVSMKDDMDHEKVASGNPEATNPKAETYGIHSPTGWQELPVAFKVGSDLNQDQISALQAAMGKWERAVGRKLFDFQGVEKRTGADFNDLYSSLEGDNVNSHYMDDNWGKNQKPQVVLATTIWDNLPNNGQIYKADIHYNHQYYIIGDSMKLKATESKEVVDMTSLALHELGHLLGLAHIDPSVDAMSIMNPSLFIGEGLTSRYLSDGDFQRIQSIYGCHNEECKDIAGMMAEDQKNAESTAPKKKTTTTAH